MQFKAMLYTLVPHTEINLGFKDLYCIQVLYFPVASTIMFIFSILVINLVLMNLITSLAIDDVKEMKENANFIKLSNQVIFFNLYYNIM